MENRLNWIEYKGKKMFHIDLSGLDEANQLIVLEGAAEKWINSDEKIIYLLNDVSNTFTTSEIKETAKMSIQALKDDGKDIIIALVGITGLKRLIANAIMKGMYFAKNIEDAKEWLLKQ